MLITRRGFLEKLLGVAAVSAVVAKATAAAAPVVATAPASEVVMASASLPSNHLYYWYEWRHKFKDLPIPAPQVELVAVGAK